MKFHPSLASNRHLQDLCRVADTLFAVATLLMGIATPLSSKLFHLSFLIALIALALNPSTMRTLLSKPYWLRQFPTFLPFALLLLLGIHHAIALSDGPSLILNAACAPLLIAILATPVARNPRNFIFLAQGLFIGLLCALIFREHSAPSAAPLLFLGTALLLESIALFPALTWRFAATFAAQAAILFICFAAFDCWPLLLLLPFAIAPAVAQLIARIPYSIGRLSVWIGIVFVWLFCASYLAHVVDAYFTGHRQERSHLPALTRNGNPYRHDTLSNERENGYYVRLYLCPKELESQWPSISETPLSATTPNGLTIEETLIRYLTSRDLRKDSVGISQLSPADVSAIEQGLYNCSLVGKSFVFQAAWHELENIDRYLITRQPSSPLTAILHQSSLAASSLQSPARLGAGLRYAQSEAPLASGILFLPLAIGIAPSILLFALFAIAASAAYLPKNRIASRQALRHLGFTSLSLAATATICAGTLLTPAFPSSCAILLALAMVGKTK